MPGELDFINWIKRQGSRGGFVQVPPGDDLAVLNWPPGDLLLVGVDQVLDGVHFDSAVHSPRDIGRKAMNRNLSDCAAMACLPAAAVATVAAPAGAGVEYLRELYRGLRDAADPFDCPIVGGDTGSWPGKLVLTVTILGRSGGIPPFTRGGAKAGDKLWVTGPLGGSILGRHMAFTPRVELARKFAATGLVTAMIDLSDGLSRDLRHICDAAGLGATVFADRIPIHTDVMRPLPSPGTPGEGRVGARARTTAPTSTLPRHAGGGSDLWTPLEHALHDGEDYELLFTAKPGFATEEATFIGEIVAEKGVWLVDAAGACRPLQAKAWEHSL